ncbi:MAG: hypothetical protein Kow00121_67220 [Elainellaceae cyanobacterium]
MVGIVIVLISAAFFAAQNVIVRVLFQESLILGTFSLGGFINPDINNSLLLLGMRTLLMVGLMAISFPSVYQPIWSDIRQLGNNFALSLRILGSGACFFFTLMLVYVAIGNIPTGIAIALFFIYPAITVFLAWGILGDRPTALRLIVMLVILIGVFLVNPISDFQLPTNLLLGVIASLTGGISYAIYSILAQRCLTEIHPIPYSFMVFWVILLLTGISLLWLSPHVRSESWVFLWMGSLISAVITLVGHVLNNVGIRFVGAVTSSLASGMAPVFTTLLAWLMLEETLQSQQAIGIGLVSLGVAALGLARTQKQPTSN